MGKMERDINKLCMHFCPEGVDYYKLGELGKFYGGLTGKNKSDFSDGNAKFISYRNVYNNPALKLDVEDKVKISSNEKQNTLERGDIIFTGSSETADECGLSSVVTQDVNEKIYLNSFCFIFRFKNPKIILPDFSKHLFRSEYLRHQIGKTASGVTRFNVSKKLMANVTIPLPPLPIQQEIVRILDTFTNLTAELTAELTARRKQYEYYRDELLTFGEDIERRTIGDVCLKIASGGTPATGKMEYYGGDIPWLRTQEVDWNDIWDTGVKISKAGLENSSAKWIPENCVVVAMYGATAAKVAVNRIPLTTNQACCNLLINEKIVMHRYVFYWLSKEYLHLKEMGQGSQSNINAKIIRNYLIPIPPMERQQYIVSILDRFRELCSAFSGISEEILLRQKQYEYYRDKLLNFREK